MQMRRSASESKRQSHNLTGANLVMYISLCDHLAPCCRSNQATKELLVQKSGTRGDLVARQASQHVGAVFQCEESTITVRQNVDSRR
jgi:hypothetical protein